MAVTATCQAVKRNLDFTEEGPLGTRISAKQNSNHIMPVSNMDKVEWVIKANKKHLSLWLAITD